MMYSYGPPHMAEQKEDDQHEHTFSNYVRIRDVVQKTCQRRWTIGKSGERGSGVSMLPARHDDDDDPLLNKLVVSYLSNKTALSRRSNDSTRTLMLFVGFSKMMSGSLVGLNFDTAHWSLFHYPQTILVQLVWGKSPCDVAHILDCHIVVSKFELQSFFFGFWKSMNSTQL